MHGWTKTGTGAAVMLALTAAAAAADSDDVAPPLELDYISVTAMRTPIEAFDYPGMVSVVDSGTIRERQPSTPDDILGDLPGVEFTGGPRRTGEVPSIRGLAGADVVVTLDGARQNFLSGHDGRFFVDPSLLREVEVVRGPASSLYGSGATGGVIALRTLRAEDLLAPDEHAGIWLRGGYQGVNHERHAGVTAYGRPRDDLGVLASITRRDSGTIELGDGNELTNSDDDIVSGLAKGRWQPDEDSEVELSFQRFDNDAREPNNGQGAGDENSVAKDIRADTARLRYAHDDPSDPWVDLAVSLYRNETRVDERRLDDDGLGPEGERLRRHLDTTGLRLDNSSQTAFAGAETTVTYGVEGYRDVQDGGDASGERAGVPDAEYDFAAVFAQAELRWSAPGGMPGELLLIPGVRYDRFKASADDVDEDLSDDAVSPRLGLTWKPTRGTMLFVNRAEAFRAPTLGEAYPSGTHFQIPLGAPFGTITNRFESNPDLEPQRTQTWEFGGGLRFPDVLVDGDRFGIKLSHYEIHGDDFIDTQVRQPSPFADCNPAVPGACDGTTRSVNVAEARLWGDEIEAHYRVGRLRTSLGFSRIDGEDERTGEKLGVLTPPQVSLSARYELPATDTTVGARLLHAAEFDEVDDPSEERASYTVVDLSATWRPRRPALRGLTVRLGVDNAFDEAYSRTYTGAAEPGRNVRIALGYRLSW
ncbi:TonB-dependent hemoglobin/transferrin/lactoferrin family receptor [Arhodomonas aquaeolei]|uniref:TonB-dependent hemoglobin/transferrin/lactoferrin family receptor n=1 Tax=Arhodomonas TaxID=2368 RepID=UPI0013D8B92B|nr:MULTISPECIES: TonB-dependent hemoglobin/transferrin/lactoferrin family receptor [Arhodomonas]MCS4505121.1 TonB-dependent hemoglobin/transferrin/lactoferrin family receptor [Arhodomonas aquaeolei]